MNGHAAQVQADVAKGRIPPLKQTYYFHCRRNAFGLLDADKVTDCSVVPDEA